MPVCLDATKEGEALVPEAFLAVQWTRLRQGVLPPAFLAQVKRLLAAVPDQPDRPRCGAERFRRPRQPGRTPTRRPFPITNCSGRSAAAPMATSGWRAG
ncbi:MAG: hypothetical protein WDM96_00075 [Lacunisphaera sp.]